MTGPASSPRASAWRPPLLAWLLVSVLLLLTSLGGVLAGEFPDPDDALRLVQVRDLIAGQNWFDFHQYRINPTEPPVMHWSRLVDVPLLAIIAALAPLVGQSAAEHVASVIVPLLALLVTILAIARVAARLVEREAVILAGLSVGFMPMLVYQFQPMRIDHHGWQIALTALALVAVFGAHKWRGGALAGLAMAAGMMISLELLPVAAIFAGMLALRWLRDRDERQGLVGYLQALAVGLVALFLATRGAGDVALWCDAITWPHIAFFAIVAAGATLVSRFRAKPLVAMAGLAVTGGIALAAFGLLSPECLRTPFGALDPVVRDFWYFNVSEGRPIWEQSGNALAIAFQILVGIAVTIWLLRKAGTERTREWIDFAVLLGGLSLLGLFVWRSMAFASVLATIPIGMVLHLGLKQLRSATNPAIRIGTILGLFVVLAPMALVTGAKGIVPQERAEASAPQAVQLEASGCELRESAEKLGVLAPTTIFAPLDIGPAILQHSRHAVIATAHHRAEQSMRDVILTFVGSPDRARTMVAKHGATYVALCTDLIEADLYATKGGADSFAARLRKGDAPEWLEPVDVGAPESFKVWRVKN